MSSHDAQGRTDSLTHLTHRLEAALRDYFNPLDLNHAADDEDFASDMRHAAEALSSIFVPVGWWGATDPVYVDSFHGTNRRDRLHHAEPVFTLPPNPNRGGS